MLTAKNIIRKQTIDFQYNGNADGFALQKEVSDWCKYMLIPEIEQQLELFDFDDSYVVIDKLEIGAVIDKKDWQKQIRAELISNLSRQLRDYKPDGKKVETKQHIESRSHKLDELILFYFEKGYLTWWSKAFIENDFSAVLLNWIAEEKSQVRAGEIVLRLKQISSNYVIKRILSQMHGILFFKWAKHIFNKEIDIINEAESFFNTAIKTGIATAREKALSAIFNEVLLSVLINNEGKVDVDLIMQVYYVRIKNELGSTTTVLKTLLVNPSLSGNSFAKSLQKHFNEDKKSNAGKNIALIKEETKLKYQRVIDQLTVKGVAEKNKEQANEDLREGIYIENGGAVIVAAYLPTLFQRLGITDQNKMLKPDLAALIIQYIVTGKVKAEEHELLLPKIFCGIDPELPVNTNKRISRAQRIEAEEMLKSVIEYWAVIKNTSVEGLRESFLKRTAKLMLVDDEWFLQVEQKPYDMLLQQLPWNISMIKLPWMQRLLKTEWV